ncbi:MAG: trypsin-like serine protease [Myxococcales bacterium]|nr:trypsin-like serine protease [Myxococcales bacterium]
MIARLALLGLALTGAASAAPVSTHVQAIRNGTRSPQIVPLTEGEQLAIGWLFVTGDPSSAFCTGTLVSPTVVVTAAHCTRTRFAESIGFGIGMLPEDPVATFTVARVDNHPSADVDASFLHLSEPVTARVPGLQPLPINRHPIGGADGDVLLGRQVEVAGFGDTRDPLQTGRFFASVTLIEINDAFVVVDGEGLQGLCFGDSGGPVLTLNAVGDAVLLGVEHGGDDTCVGRDLLTRLDALGEFVEAAVPSGAGEPAPLAEPGGPCEDLTFQGRCVGDFVEWCDESGRVARLDCALHGRVCGYIDQDTGYYCTTEKICAPGETGDCRGVAPGTAGFVAPGARSARFRGGCEAVDAPTGAPWLLALLLLWVRPRRSRTRRTGNRVMRVGERRGGGHADAPSAMARGPCGHVGLFDRSRRSARSHRRRRHAGKLG